jgi:hypothetical protein
VWVDRVSRRPTPVPGAIREALAPLLHRACRASGVQSPRHV